MRTKAALVCAIVLALGVSGEAVAGTKKTIKTDFDSWGHYESSGKLAGVFGWISSNKEACEKKRRIVVFRKTKGKGKDQRVAVTRTGALLDNRFDIEAEKPWKAGRYYLRAPKKKLKKGVFCGAAKSDVRKLP